ncbi:MAG: hypothetical protein U9R79_07885 [Armatimonadota bacterium]|nr:hypothetical protein [Armatimonadota bacterium]
MNGAWPETTGYPLEEALRLLKEAGYEVGEIERVGPEESGCEGDRAFVVRERGGAGRSVTLTIAGEWKTPRETGRE